MSKFPLGQVVATPAALETMASMDGMVNANTLLRRHASGDWGDIDPGDVGMNDEALKTGDRIFSVYKFGNKTMWLITEADRSATTLLTPSDY
jgi:hypothetical protein